MARRRVLNLPILLAAFFCTVIGYAGVIAASHQTSANETGVVVDTALILAVDVSDSVDESRYRLQIEGIAQALEDKAVVDAIVSGPAGGIGLSLVLWADHARLALPWRVIRSLEDAVAFANDVRRLPQQTGEYTCLARMFEMTRRSIVTDIPMKAARVVLDVSGDGIDNCNVPEDTLAERDALIAAGVTINGLPIIVKGENEIVGSGAYRAPGFGLRELPKGPDSATTTLDAWYANTVIGGGGAFLLKADGFEDFGRAFRQKFVSEISMK
jgi:Protein of unknown function (DUF1194)